MQNRKRLLIGSSDYEYIIEQNGYFVDKTLFIKEILDSGYYILLIPRPRRFGKSLNLSMLRYYLDTDKKNTASLFEPYKIWQAGEYYTSQLGKYPVIFLSMKEGKATTFEKSKAGIFSILRKVYLDFKWLLDKNILLEEEKDDFLKITKGIASSTIFENSLKNLSEYLHRYYGERAFVLMDEYDAPIHTGFQNGFYKEIIDLMKSIMSKTFKDNVHLHKGVITGILRVAKESIFSDLNNPGIFTILNYSFADKFGFTEKEVQKMLTYFQLEEHLSNVKTWYDGYKFGQVEHIYNPWSVINYISNHQEGFRAHWANTSSDELIKSRIIEKNATEVRTTIEGLTQGKTIEKTIDENIVFSDFYESKDILWSLLVFCGYLRPLKKVGRKDYVLKVPNYEIQTLFQDIILEWLKTELKINERTLKAMARSLVKNKISDFKKYFNKVMQDTFSYFDVNTEPERVYQAYVLGLLGILSDDYIIKSNRESGGGRYDIMLLPRKNHEYGVIIEVKQLAKDASDKRIQAEISDALNQIKKNKYHKELDGHKVNNKIEMAMVFVGKSVYVGVN